ncbi:hypothetical protein A3K80_01715 [Candidatus Bathyarchaeota archaeon RBG_13_38_9]|nr:MAG: hypothetical protein A3K80_01715 [Candidatus Bathyarchaeota archaeon RBG_13_38_9]
MAETIDKKDRSYSEDQIEKLFELHHDSIHDRIELLRKEISYSPFLSLALAFVVGFSLGLALVPRSSK